MSKVQFIKGQDIFKTPVDALVNPVNTDGIMGKGLALQFKLRYPDMFEEYKSACQRGEVRTGSMHIVQRLISPKWIINFPTKQHWFSPSKTEYIALGLNDLISAIRMNGIKSIAIPPLGCGLGGLNWSIVKPMIVDVFEKEAALEDFPCDIVYLYES